MDKRHFTRHKWIKSDLRRFSVVDLLFEFCQDKSRFCNAKLSALLSFAIISLALLCCLSDVL